MKEILVRIGYVLLGVMITLVGMFVVKEFQREEEQVLVSSADTNAGSSVENDVETLEMEAATKTEQDYEADAKEIMADMEAKREKTEETVTENKTVSANSIEAAKVKWLKNYPTNNAELSLEENLNLKSSYEQTLEINAYDKQIIANSTIDFSDMKIAILGDSLTAASNLDDAEAAQYSIPAVLKEILGAKEVYNLGIGGSTISRCSTSYPMVDRWSSIPKDTDIIIVFGSTNDALFENKWDFGNIEYEKRMTKGTFCGDLDEMLGAIKYTYREHNKDSYVKFLIVNPPSTVLNDAVYNTDPGNMVHQGQFALAINEIAPAYGFEVIDMYNNNFMNTHDRQVNEEFMPDGVHGNVEGYRMMAEHLASEIIQRIEQ